MSLSSQTYLDRLQSDRDKFLDELILIIRAIAAKWNWTNMVSLDDIVQDCFLKLICNLEKGQFSGQSSFKTYVYAITRNTCIDYFRASKQYQSVDADKTDLIDQSVSADDRIVEAEDRRTASKVIRALSGECRRLWRAIFFGKRNYRQAADLLGLKEGTVKRKMWECRKQARQLVLELEK